MSIAIDELPLLTDGDAESERAETKALGFWLYLMTDAVIFALLFATYVVMLRGTAGGPTGQRPVQPVAHIRRDHGCSCSAAPPSAWPWWRRIAVPRAPPSCG